MISCHSRAQADLIVPFQVLQLARVSREAVQSSTQGQETHDLTEISGPLALSPPTGQGGSLAVWFHSSSGIPLGLLFYPTGSEGKHQGNSFQVSIMD